LSPQSMVYFIMEASLKTDANSLLIDMYQKHLTGLIWIF
jgi:hypothetical protein